MSWVDKFLSPSRCDMFTQYQLGELYSFGDRPEFTTELFIDKLLKIEDPTCFRKANAGSAFHKSLELAKYGILPSSWVMDDWLIKVECDIDVALPECREMWVKGNIAGHNIIGKVDAIDGNAVHDIKTTSSIDFEKYMTSWQWRMYLMLTGLDVFIYDVFVVKVDDNENIITIKDYHRMELSRYSTMESSIVEMIEEYVDTLFKLEPMILDRCNQYNKQLELLIEQLKKSKEWALSAIPDLDAAINALTQKKIFIKGLNDEENIYYR